MSALKYWTTVICALFTVIGAASGEDVNVFGEVGGNVSFRPTSLPPPKSGIIWKQVKGVEKVKAIEWDAEDGFDIPNPRFKGITALDEKTGEITITKLKFEHSGIYTIDISSKEQQQRFSLTVLARVPKPVIKIEKIEVNPNAVYLICEYNETIIWKNSAGETLKGTPHTPKGEFITVEKKGNPDVFYTCTLKNAVSESTSDPVYERDLFKESVKWWIALIVIPVLILALFVLLYKFWSKFHDSVNTKFKGKPCIGGFLNLLDGKNNIEEDKRLEEGTVKRNGDEKKPDEDKPNENLLKEDSETLN